jgi:Fe-S-cluster containining protein
LKKPFLNDGVKFQCQGSGKCCTSHGEFGFVFLTLKDRRATAKYLEISTREFTLNYCEKKNDFFHLIERPNNPDCLFFKNKCCGIYPARPTQCRTWPFWPEIMNAKAWKKEIVQFCPGANKGKVWTYPEIKEQMDKQKKSEKELHSEALNTRKRNRLKRI